MGCHDHTRVLVFDNIFNEKSFFYKRYLVFGIGR